MFPFGVESMPQSSPFAKATQSASATFSEYAGWELPTNFGDWRNEYDAVRTSAALFDCSNHGQLEITGPEAPSFLTNLSTNDIVNLALGAGCETYFLNARARVLFQTIVYHVLLDGKRNGLWIDVTPGYHEKLLKHLDRHLISEQAEIVDRTIQFGQLHLAGPSAKTVLEKALGEPIPELSEFLHMERTIGTNAVCHIRRHDLLGVTGYDVVCLNERAEGVWRMLASCGAKPAGMEAYEVLRIEAGTPVYGADIDENRFVMEVGGVARAVCYTKGCFVGQEPIIMSRDRAGFVNRAFMKLKVIEGNPLPTGTPLFHNNEDIGLVTSSTETPNSGVVALGYIRRGHQEAGTIFDAKVGEEVRKVMIV